MHIELLNGQNAELRDAETFTRRDRSALYDQIRAAEEADDKDNPQDLGSVAIFAGLVTSWTLDSSLPPTLETVDGLLAMDFSAIDQACATILRKLSPNANFAQQTENGTIEQSPTVPSSD